MNKTLLKFTNYLDASAEELKHNIQMRVNKVGEEHLDAFDKIAIDKYNERINMSRILKVPRESWKMYGELFVDFKTLSELMMAGGLKNKEVFVIVFHLLEKNLGAHVLDASVRFFDIKKMETYDFSNYKHLNKKVIVDMVRTEEYGRLVSAPEGTLTEEEQEKLDEFERFTKDNPEDATGVIDKHKLLQEHYFDKLDSFNIEDVEIVCGILRDFSLYESYIEIIKSLLLQKVEKRSKQDIPIVVEKVEVKSERHLLSSKEYNFLNRELRKYFDVTNMVVTQPFNLELQIYCVSLMIRMEFDDNTIRKALKVMNKSLIQEENPIVVFTKLYSKLMYYENIPDLKEAVDNIMSYLVEMFITNDEDYEVLKGFIGEEINKIQDNLIGTFDYEIEEAFKLSKGMK